MLTRGGTRGGRQRFLVPHTRAQYRRCHSKIVGRIWPSKGIDPVSVPETALVQYPHRAIAPRAHSTSTGDGILRAQNNSTARTCVRSLTSLIDFSSSPSLVPAYHTSVPHTGTRTPQVSTAHWYPHTARQYHTLVPA
eukprot:2815491-Rhodomonas_salina.4